MTEFAYLSVLLSIIFGLAIAHLLQGWRAVILQREKVIGYWPVQVWAIFLLIVCVQAWWAMFGLRGRQGWTFVEFISLLAETIAIYLTAGLVFPDFNAKETTDLRVHFFANHRYFFGSMTAILVASIGRNLAIDRTLPEGPNMGFHVFFLISAITGAISANEKYHKFMAVFIAVSFLVYVALLFARLH